MNPLSLSFCYLVFLFVTFSETPPTSLFFFLLFNNSHPYSHPMVATRTDKRGLVISISFSMGENGGKEDALRMVQNALALQRVSFF